MATEANGLPGCPHTYTFEKKADWYDSAKKEFGSTTVTVCCVAECRTIVLTRADVTSHV